MQLKPLSLHLVLVPASQSLGDTLLTAPCCSIPTRMCRSRQESCGSLVTVVNSQAVANGSPARGKFATLAPASRHCAPMCGAGLSHRCATGSSAGTCSFSLRHPGTALYCFLSEYRVRKFTEADGKEVAMYYHALSARLLIYPFSY